MEILVEKMGLKDLGDVVSIERNSFSFPWTEGMFEKEIQLPISSFFIMRLKEDENCNTAGYAGFWKIGKEAHIINLAIAEKFRRKGFATKLLEHIIKFAGSLGLKRAILEVRVSNLPAQGLYIKAGFSNIGMRKKFYPDNNEDAIVMVRDI